MHTPRSVCTERVIVVSTTNVVIVVVFVVFVVIVVIVVIVIVVIVLQCLSWVAPPRRTSTPASCAGALTMPVSLVAPEAWGSFWVVMHGVIIAHFGGPWAEHEKAEHVAQLARGDATVFSCERSFSISNGAWTAEVLGFYGLREGETAELSAYDGSRLLYELGRLSGSRDKGTKDNLMELD